MERVEAECVVRSGGREEPAAWGTGVAVVVESIDRRDSARASGRGRGEGDVHRAEGWCAFE